MRLFCGHIKHSRKSNTAIWLKRSSGARKWKRRRLASSCLSFSSLSRTAFFGNGARTLESCVGQHPQNSEYIRLHRNDPSVCLKLFLLHSPYRNNEFSDEMMFHLTLLPAQLFLLTPCAPFIPLFFVSLLYGFCLQTIFPSLLSSLWQSRRRLDGNHCLSRKLRSSSISSPSFPSLPPSRAQLINKVSSEKCCAACGGTSQLFAAFMGWENDRLADIRRVYVSKLSR